MADTLIRPATQQLRGRVRAIDLERNICAIRTDSGLLISCTFDEDLKPKVIEALDHMASIEGQPTLLRLSDGHAEVTEIKIEKLDVEDEFDIEATGLKPFTGRDLLESGLIGMWKDRTDMDDSNDFARRLRELKL